MVGLKADLVLVNGRVVDFSSTAPDAIAVYDGKIVAVGSTSDMDGLIGPGTEVIDLHGRSVLPGFIDSHNHMLKMGKALVNVRLHHVKSVEDILDAIREALPRYKPDEWIEGKGWQKNRFTPETMPTRWDLDTLNISNPIALEGQKEMLLNSKAIEIAGITRNTPDPPGSRIGKDEKGEPNGLFFGASARAMIRESLPDFLHPPVETMHAYIKASQDLYLSEGITSLLEPGVLPWWMKGYQRLREQGELKLRIALMPDFRDVFYPLLRERVTHMGVYTGFGDDQLYLGPLKSSFDGGKGGFSIWMYDQPEGTEPALRIPLNEVESSICWAHEQGWSIGIHVIGDHGTDVIVDAMAEAYRRMPSKHIRHQVIHGFYSTDETLRKMARYGIALNQQPSFLYYKSDGGIIPSAEDMYQRIRTAQGMGIRMTMSSDVWSVPDPNPMIGIYSAVTRKTADGEVINASEAVSRLDALKMYTINNAYLTEEEHKKGSLTVGKLADMVVLNGDYMTVTDEELIDLKVDLTIIGGRIVYRR